MDDKKIGHIEFLQKLHQETSGLRFKEAVGKLTSQGYVKGPAETEMTRLQNIEKKYIELLEFHRTRTAEIQEVTQKLIEFSFGPGAKTIIVDDPIPIEDMTPEQRASAKEYFEKVLNTKMPTGPVTTVAVMEPMRIKNPKNTQQ